MEAVGHRELSDLDSWSIPDVLPPAGLPSGRRWHAERRQDVHLLLFELGGQLYGVDVEQVEAIVEEWSHQGQEIPVQDLALWIGLEASKEGEASRLLLSRSEGGLRGFLVDTPQDIAALSLECIFPIPSLIRQVLGHSPLWGVAQWPKGLILLVDLTANL